MRLSAKNVLKGKIKSIVPGAVNAEVIITLPGGDDIVAMITKSSVENLELKPGKTAYAVIKASHVIVGVD